jgi:hypothetical protein
MYRSDDNGCVRVKVILVSMCPEIDDAFIRNLNQPIYASRSHVRIYLSASTNEHKPQHHKYICYCRPSVSVASINNFGTPKIYVLRPELFWKLARHFFNILCIPCNKVALSHYPNFQHGEPHGPWTISFLGEKNSGILS